MPRSCPSLLGASGSLGFVPGSGTKLTTTCLSTHASGVSPATIISSLLVGRAVDEHPNVVDGGTKEVRRELFARPSLAVSTREQKRAEPGAHKPRCSKAG